MTATSVTTPEDAAEMSHASKGAIILAHADFVKNAFIELAFLMQMPGIRLVFYSTEETDKLKAVPVIPDDIDILVSNLRKIMRL